MSKNATSCFKVSDTINCPKCKEKKVIKNGRTKNNKQQYYCKTCCHRFIENYSYQAYNPNTNQNIIKLTKEGLGIRSIARILKISPTTLLKRIVSIAKSIISPIISKGKTYEVDELCTYIRHKKNYIWLVYALERNSKNVVSFNVGKRTNRTLSQVLETLKLSDAKKIYTDRLKNYSYLIDEKLHSVKRFGTNHIERKNLTLRTHLKRLNRRTICFSKSLLVLVSILKIYFWI
ncbi:IS1 family transposase [Flavobacterium sediminis]|uniref:IS1 family transposase n=1 Tax=Flavobacterium sediminis TaxID=2201181 RepID=A0A2U8QS71_9FLAO|nr:IS1 family transposase [Flavobacterium sediminis]AWM12959.1 IS1 family transposase [Flavobacterium sediminis]